MIILLIIILALIALTIFVAINFVPICIIFLSICGIGLIVSTPKHGRR